MISLVWTIWVLHQILVLIILLNFLIAIISQSYENVMSKLEVFKYKTRADFNLECLQVMEFFGRLESFDTLLLVTQNEDVTDANEWTGIINTIKTFSR